jgi:hypothetical protein
MTNPQTVGKNDIPNQFFILENCKENIYADTLYLDRNFNSRMQFKTQLP